ncbi:MAG: PspC domain-containing protein [Candidatus Dormibacteria bacterium]
MNTPPPPPPVASTRRRLQRPMQDRMIAGVAAGLAEHLDVDVTIVRIIIAMLVVCGGAGVALYIAGWLLIPNEGSERSIANKLTGTCRASSQS